jgi:methylthioribose-1-phosphate isomerase
MILMIKSANMRTIEWKNNKVRIIDQTKLPHKLVYLNISTIDQMIEAIKSMKIRGAPALGAAAAFGCVLGAAILKKTAHKLFYSRPTAVNIRWALDRMMKVAAGGKGLPAAKFKQLLLKEAQMIAQEDIEINKRIGQNGLKMIKSGNSILTVCNAGALATVDYGTALGVIRAAHEAGKKIHVFVAETRPRLQGARLTAWELRKEGIPFTLITDNMIAHFMQQGEIDLVITGADRIARNGDTANKIGTLAAALLAREHGIPFYIAAPMSTIDHKTASGKSIVIEERPAAEVTTIGKERIAPEGVKVRNPAFDVTPARYIKAFITENGLLRPDLFRNFRG